MRGTYVVIAFYHYYALMILGLASQQFSSASMEALIEELMDLHGSSSSFRQVFKSQQTTQLFVDAYKSFVSAVISANETSITATRILEKLTHFGLSLALDNCVSGSQKREVYVDACCFPVIWLTLSSDTRYLTISTDHSQPHF